MEDASVVWDGKDFAAIQMITAKIRDHGRPYATVDKDWNLSLGGTPVPIGTEILSDGCFELPEGWVFEDGKAVEARPLA